MKPLFMALLAIVVTASACKKERANVDTRVNPPKVRLKVLKETDNKKITSYELSYDTDGYLSRYIITNKYNTDDRIYSTTTRYERDANHRITRAIQDDRNYVATYHYDANGLLQEVKHTGDGISTTATCAWDRGKLVKIALMTGGEELASHTYTYDTKGNHTTVIYTYYNASDIYELRFDDRPNYAETIKGKPVDYYSFLGSTSHLSTNNVTNIRILLDDAYGYYLMPGALSLTYNKYGHLEREVLNSGERVREFSYEEIK